MQTLRIAKIDLTEEQALAANIEALGLSGKTGTLKDRIYNGLLEMIRERGEFVTLEELGTHIGVLPSTCRLNCTKMVEEGRMMLAKNPRTGKSAYIPVVV